LKKPAGQRKETLSNKIDAVINRIETGAYEGAIDKLEDDIKEKLDFDGIGDWLMVAHPELVDKIDLIISVLESL